MCIPALKDKTYQWLTVLWAVLIIGTSSIPNLKSGSLFTESDKFIHIGIYAVLAWFLSGALRQHTRHWHVFLQILISVILVTGFGCLDELHQSFVMGRTASLWDLLADVTGGFIGAITFTLLHKKTVELRK